MDDVEMLFLENIEEFVMDENKIVSFKYLACTLEIHVNHAKRLLREYVFPGGKRRSDVNITYVLGGQLLDDKGYNISLVRENDLSEVAKRFSSVEFKEIFCIHKVSSILDLNVIYGIDGNLHSSKPRITCKNAIPRAPRAQLVAPVAATRQPVKVVPAASTEVVKEPEVPAKMTPKTGIASIFGAAPTKKSPVVNSTTAKPKKGGITSFFSKQDKVVPESKLQDTKTVELKEKDPIRDTKSESTKTDTLKPGSSKENSPTNADSPKAEKRRTEKPQPEKASKSSRKKRAVKEVATKKRKRIMVLSDSESSGSEGSEEERCPSPDAPPPDAPPPGFCAESSDEEIVPATPVRGAPSRKKILRVKTTIDDEGFVVTTKEWGWESDGEAVEKDVKKEEDSRLKEGKKDVVKDNNKEEVQKNVEKDNVKKEGKESGKKIGMKNNEKKNEDSDQKEMKKGKKEATKETKDSVKTSKKKKFERRESEEKEVEEEVKAVKEKKPEQKKESKAEAKKREKETGESESKKKEKEEKTESNKTSKETKKAGSKRKLIEVDPSEDEAKEKEEKVKGPQAAKRQPAKKQPPKKPAVNGAGTKTGTQTNIMAFFSKK